MSDWFPPQALAACLEGIQPSAGTGGFLLQAERLIEVDGPWLVNPPFVVGANVQS